VPVTAQEKSAGMNPARARETEQATARWTRMKNERKTSRPVKERRATKIKSRAWRPLRPELIPGDEHATRSQQINNSE
jgi:hypothetical protein